MEDVGRSGKFSYERGDDVPVHDVVRETRDSARDARDEREARDAGVTDFSVFVTDIARGVTDDHLKEKFRDFGTVQEAFVVKNKFTGETKGYGFVRFSNMDEVYRVLDAKELPRFEDSVSHKVQMVKATIADPKDTLLIINIPRGWEEPDLIKALTDVTSEAPRKVKFSGAGKSTAYASYVDHEQALRVLKCVQRPPSGLAPPAFAAYLAPPRVFDAKNAPTTKILFVRGTSGLQSDNLKKVFGGPDVVEKVIVPNDSSRGNPVGHAFVHFFTTKAAAEAKDAINGHEFEGNRLTVEWCLPKNVTHHKKPLPVTPSPYTYPYYPGYPPFYADYDMYYPPPPSYYSGYDYPSQYESAPPRGADYRSSSSDARSYPYPARGGSQYSHYPPSSSSSSSSSAYPPSSYPYKGSSSYRQTSPPHSSRPPYPSSGYDRASRSSYPPSSSYSSSRSSSRYVPY